jgi:hypothetical protein
VVVTATMGFPSVPVTALPPLVRVTVMEPVTAGSPESSVPLRLVSTYSSPEMVPGAAVTPWFCTVLVFVVTVSGLLIPAVGLTKLSAVGLVKVTTYPLAGGTSAKLYDPLEVVTGAMVFPSVPVTALPPLVRVTVMDEVTAGSPGSSVLLRLLSTYSSPEMVPGAAVTPWFCTVVLLVVTARGPLTPPAGETKLSPLGSVKVTV